MAGRLVLETARLTLREFDAEDVEAYYRIGSNAAVVRYTGTGPLESLDHARQILQANPLADYSRDGFGRWACVLKGSGAVIGFAGLKRLADLKEVDVAFWLLPEHWGQGLATEAGRAALDYGFTHLGLKRIIGLVAPENLGSRRVLEKLGMSYSGMIDYQGDATVQYSIESGGSSQDVP